MVFWVDCLFVFISFCFVLLSCLLVGMVGCLFEFGFGCLVCLLFIYVVHYALLRCCLVWVSGCCCLFEWVFGCFSCFWFCLRLRFVV